MMKRNTIIFWILTGLLIPAFGIGSVMAVLGDPKSAEVFTSLGYPVYLSPFLGIARILALIVLVIPNYPRLKEWAYAGLVFDVIGAIYSQIAIENPFSYTIFPIISLGLIFGSYYFYHKRLNHLVINTN
ncbi:MAG: DoxX family protein [Cytophagaceae bacterium]